MNECSKFTQCSDMLIIKYINKVQMNMHTMYQYFEKICGRCFNGQVKECVIIFTHCSVSLKTHKQISNSLTLSLNKHKDA